VFPGLTVLLTAGLTGVSVTGDLFNFYVFFELAMTAGYVLATYGGTRRELGGALVFAAVNLFGTFVFLISVAGVYHVTGTLDMAAIAARMGDVNPNAAVLIAVGFFVAFGVKLGLFPFHFWLPTVYTSAEPAVAAILSGGLANIGGYGLLRFGGYLLPDELELAATALIVVGAASILYGGVLAISRRTAAEMLAYSAIGQVGYVLVAIGVGGPVGFGAAVLYTIVNALNKTLLFLSAQIRGGLVAAAFAIGAMSVAGLPPAAGFVGKLELFRAAGGSATLLALLLAGRAQRAARRPATAGADCRPRPARSRLGRLARAAARTQSRRRPRPRRRCPVRGILHRAAGLVAVYLLVLTSAMPGDVLIGALLALPIVVALRPRRARPLVAPVLTQAWAAGGLLAQTASEMVRGSWRVARYCVGGEGSPGLVEIPQGDRSPDGVALWGVLTGEAPDEIPVDVDDRRRVLIVHLIDASDPAAVRARHARTHERWQRRVVP
jgi:multisubunit Na+/H+ antiporter MnhE subunit